jgi:hypothetical protein
VTAISYATDGLIKAAQELSALNNNNGNGNFEPSSGSKAEQKKSSSGEKGYPKDYVTERTKNSSAQYKSERHARNIARQKLGSNPVQVGKNKWRSKNGKWQYRAKPGDTKDRHIHLEELDPKTGEVLQNYHLRW